MRWDGPDGYWVSDDRTHVDLHKVHAWISSQSYWARGRTLDVMRSAIEHSIALGLYSSDGEQAGFARVVTDRATFAWLCDVFVDESLRSRGLGSFLVAVASEHPDVAGVRQLLMA